MLTLNLPGKPSIVWQQYPDTSPDMEFTDPAEFIDWAIDLAPNNCPNIYVRDAGLETVMALFATQIWTSNAARPSSIWVGRNGEKYFTGYTYDEGDFYGAANEYVQRINI